MTYELHETYCILRRDPGDPRLYHESTVGYHLKRLLNEDGQYHFVRMNPSKHGLTGCQLGLVDRKANIILLHANYAVENAATEFNHGEVTLCRVPLM